MSKKVDLPAPLGPMSARISPRSRANDTPSTARTPPNARRTFSTSRTGARSATLARPQHAEDPARKHKHQGHEDDAEPELPVFRVTRHHGVEQLVERGAERRARQRVHAPQQHHHERLHRDRHRQRLGEHAALEEHEGAAREPAEEAGDDEGPPLVRVHVDPDRLRAARVVRSEEHTSELQSPCNLVCRLLLEKKKKKKRTIRDHNEYTANSSQT